MTNLRITKDLEGTYGLEINGMSIGLNVLGIQLDSVVRTSTKKVGGRNKQVETKELEVCLRLGVDSLDLQVDDVEVKSMELHSE